MDWATFTALWGDDNTITTNPEGGSTPHTGDFASTTLRVAQDFDYAALGTGNLKTWYDTAIGTDTAPGYVKMTNLQRPSNAQIAEGKPWKDSLTPTQSNEGTIWEYLVYDSEIYKSLKSVARGTGAYFLGRSHSRKTFALVDNGLRACGDLIFLDVAVEDGAHVVNQMTKNTAGYFSLIYGADPQGRFFFGMNSDGTHKFGNTAIIKNNAVTYSNEDNGNEGRTAALTTNEVSLEEGLSYGAYMFTALAAHVNRDRFSPTFEPTRSGSPQYYGAMANRACIIFDSVRANWKRKAKAKATYNSDGTPKNEDARKLTMPLAIQSHLLHPAVGEILAYVSYAKIKGGVDWKTHWAYLEAARAWSLLFGPLEKCGGGQADAKCMWYEATHATLGHCVLMAHHVKRWNPGTSKDVNGEYLPSYGISGIHLNDYTTSTYGAILCMKNEGVDFISDWFMQGIANTVVATCLRTDTPYTHSGGASNNPYSIKGKDDLNGMRYSDAYASPPGWDLTANPGSGSTKSLLASFAVAGLARWDVSGRLAPRLAEEYAKGYGGRSSGWSAATALMLHYAVAEGKVTL